MRNNVRAVVVSTAALSIIGAGGALAYWTNVSKSTGSAAVANPNLVVTAPTGDASQLRPGTGKWYYFSITNEGTGEAAVDTVAMSVAGADGTAWSASGCSAADFEVGAITFSSGAAFVPTTLSAGGRLDLQVGVVMIDRPVPQDGCKGASVPLLVTVS